MLERCNRVTLQPTERTEEPEVAFMAIAWRVLSQDFGLTFEKG